MLNDTTGFVSNSPVAVASGLQLSRLKKRDTEKLLSYE